MKKLYLSDVLTSIKKLTFFWKYLMLMDSFYVWIILREYFV